MRPRLNGFSRLIMLNHEAFILLKCTAKLPLTASQREPCRLENMTASHCNAVVVLASRSVRPSARKGNAMKRTAAVVAALLAGCSTETQAGLSQASSIDDSRWQDANGVAIASLYWRDADGFVWAIDRETGQASAPSTIIRSAWASPDCTGEERIIGSERAPVYDGMASGYRLIPPPPMVVVVDAESGRYVARNPGSSASTVTPRSYRNGEGICSSFSDASASPTLVASDFSEVGHSMPVLPFSGPLEPVAISR